MEAFEKRVPKDIWGFVWAAGYRHIPNEMKKAWLEERFFLPNGWSECRKIARIESLTRMRKHCWQTLVDVVVLDARVKGRGRPRTRSKKQQTLYYLLHRPTVPVLAEWQWPLVNLCITHGKLSFGERLWLAGRPGVLPPVLARLYCMELAVHCAERTHLHRGLMDKACDVIRAAHDFGTTARGTRNKLKNVLPAEHPATLVFLEVMAGSPAQSVRKTLGQAARVFKKELYEWEMRANFADMLRPVVVERAL
jgi:hypothetical protein